MPYTFRLKLPGTSLGEFKKVPKTKDGAMLIYPSTLNVSNGTTIEIAKTTLLKKRELLKNNSISVRLLLLILDFKHYKDSVILRRELG